ncbi:MAG: nicotinate-nucleotide adenylyltransferase [Longimicrobiales bacterium]
MDPTIRVGVLGGTFDPPHNGHLSVAQEVAEFAGLERIVWIPAGVPPHKQVAPLTDGTLRCEMVEAATGDNPMFEVSDCELGRSGVSYTVDTLAFLGQKHPDWSLCLLMGEDQLSAFHRWKEPRRIAEMAEIWAVSRGGEASGEIRGLSDVVVHTAPATRNDVSASLIRHRIAHGLSIRYMVPGPVLSIIEREQLYRS